MPPAGLLEAIVVVVVPLPHLLPAGGRCRVAGRGGASASSRRRLFWRGAPSRRRCRRGARRRSRPRRFARRLGLFADREGIVALLELERRHAAARGELDVQLAGELAVGAGAGGVGLADDQRRSLDALAVKGGRAGISASSASSSASRRPSFRTAYTWRRWSTTVRSTPLISRCTPRRESLARVARSSMTPCRAPSSSIRTGTRMPVGGDQRVDGQQPEVGRAVEQAEAVVGRLGARARWSGSARASPPPRATARARRGGGCRRAGRGRAGWRRWRGGDRRRRRGLRRRSRRGRLGARRGGGWRRTADRGRRGASGSCRSLPHTAARLVAVVVFPDPPFWLITAMVSTAVRLSDALGACLALGSRWHRGLLPGLQEQPND